MDPLHHHHHHHAPLHWGYSGTAVAHPQHHHQHTWVPPPTGTSAATTTTIPATQGSGLSSRKLKRAMSESDCEDLYSEESSKDQTSPGESDSCHMMSRKKRRGVIEKKRRDRINLSLCELKRLVPSAYEKQGSAKLEKAEILQLTVDHLKTLQHKGADGMPFDAQRFAVDYHIVGFRECASEVARYLVTMEGMDIQDPLRLRLMSHLQCFMAQRELQLKSNSGSSADLLSPNPTASSSASVGPAIVNPVSPNMDHTSSNWSSSTAYHQQAAYQMMPSTTGYPNAYASQTATGGGGYVPNLPPPLPQQYDQYGNQRSTTESSANNSNYGASDANLSSTRSGVTTRSQANNSSSTGTAANSSDVNNGGSSSADQSGPTYTDLSSSSASSASVTTSSASTTAVSASVVGVNNNNRVQSNYNVYGHIHYPADPSAFGGHHHHGYNLHLDPSRGYNGGQGNGTGAAGANAKPYRPWGAEMAY